MAEWIAPELNPDAAATPSRVRWGFYALATAAAALFIAVIVFDASSADIGARPAVMRANGMAW